MTPRLLCAILRVNVNKPLNTVQFVSDIIIRGRRKDLIRDSPGNIL